MLEVDFTWKNYDTIMKRLKERYQDVSVANAIKTTPSKSMIIRHDIDYSLARAERMAEIEHQNNVKADYFVLLDNPFYNASDADGIRHLKRIAALGHNIGIHFDVAGYKRDDFSKVVNAHKNTLENLVGCPVTSISYHNPGKLGLDTLDRSDELLGLANAYSMTLQNNYAYRSDSLMTWKDKGFFAEALAGQHDKIYLLFHADWWTDTAMNRDEKIRSIITEKSQNNWANFEDILVAYEGAA